jgi:thiol peroxidase
LDFSNKYGFLISELGILTRGTIVIDKDDIIRYVEYVPEVLSEPNYNAALDSVKKLVASK